MGLLRPPQPDLAAEPRRKRLQGWPWEIRLVVLAMIYLGPPLALAVAAWPTTPCSIPDPMALRHKERAPVVRILARDGSLLSERGGGDAYVPIDLLPRHLSMRSSPPRTGASSSTGASIPPACCARRSPICAPGASRRAARR